MTADLEQEQAPGRGVRPEEVAALADAVAAALGSLRGALTDLGVRAAVLDVEPSFLYGEERALVAEAVDSRRREFATGRRLAHALLAELGAAPAPLLPGNRRAPRWPAGIAGSISHSRELALVAVARCGERTGLGVDLEPDRLLGPELVRVVLTPLERERFAHHSGGLAAWSRLGFSAKESAYKAWSGSLDGVPEFEDVELELDPRRSRFRARLRPCRASSGAARELEGAFGRAAGHLWTAALASGPAGPE